MAPAADAGRPGAPITLAALFVGFLKVSLCGFGGGLAWARRIVVERQCWLSEEEFADTLSLCQFMPGPNMMGIAVCVGAKSRGGFGAVAALGGFLLIPWIIWFSFGVLCLEYARLAVLQHVLAGVSAAAAGLLIATGIRLLLPHLTRPMALPFAVLAFAGLAFAKLPLLVVVFVIAPLSIAAAGFEAARAR